MAYIESIGRTGRRSVNISADNLLLTSVFVSAAVSALPVSLITAFLALLSITCCTELFSRVRLWRLHAHRLQLEQGPAILDIIAREAQAMSVQKFADQPKIYYVPNARQATAFTLGGFSSKLLVTGRLIVAATAAPEAVRLIIRHELAHIANRDQRMWLVLVSNL